MQTTFDEQGTDGRDARRGKLCGVSVGPGDPELMTLKAVRAIGEADVVAVPNTERGRQMALQVAEEYVAGKELLECTTPMTRDRSIVMAAYTDTADAVCALLDAGKTVAYLCLGDITVYSTFIYVHDIVRARGYETVIIPGVTSFTASAAALGVTLCEGPERLLVVPAAATDIDAVLDVPATKVFMKPAPDIGRLRARLAERGLMDGAAMVTNCGLPDQKVFPRLEDADDVTDYFSVIIVKDPEVG